jgi:hypothetical protein
VNQPTLALIGEAGPEVVIPLNQLTAAYASNIGAVPSPQVTRSIMQGAGGGSGGGTTTVNLNAITTSDPNAISRAVVSGLRTRAA